MTASRICSTCWFASGGDADHCGQCRCCPPSAALSPFGIVTVLREHGRVRIERADSTALISPDLIGRMFADKAPHMMLNGSELVIRDDFGKFVTYRIGEYVMDGSGHGFALRREDRNRYESHQWNPDDEDPWCVVCYVTRRDHCRRRARRAGRVVTADRRDQLERALADQLQPRTGMSERAVMRLADALLPVVDAMCAETAAEALEAAATQRWQANGGYPTDWLRDRAAALRATANPTDTEETNHAR